jgi:hypothetical protein
MHQPTIQVIKMTKNINIELPENIHRELKFRALENDKTLKDLVIEILSK